MDTFGAYIPTCTACFVNGARSSTRPTVTSAGDPHAPQLSPQEMQDLQGGGIVILICLAGFLFLALTDRR
jgi:hypothetical protein